MKKQKLTKQEETALHNRLFFEQITAKFFKQAFKGESNNEETK